MNLETCIVWDKLCRKCPDYVVGWTKISKLSPVDNGTATVLIWIDVRCISKPEREEAAEEEEKEDTYQEATCTERGGGCRGNGTQREREERGDWNSNLLNLKSGYCIKKISNWNSHPKVTEQDHQNTWCMHNNR